jgi:transposase
MIFYLSRKSILTYLRQQYVLGRKDTYQRMKEFFTDLMGLPLSVGNINHILKRLSGKALPHYEQIKERIIKSILIGTDETGVKVNGQKDWIWVWQNDELTFITHSDNRGFKTIEENFTDGLPNSILFPL